MFNVFTYDKNEKEKREKAISESNEKQIKIKKGTLTFM